MMVLFVLGNFMNVLLELKMNGETNTAQLNVKISIVTTTGWKIPVTTVLIVKIVKMFINKLMSLSNL